jgi:hypothetical protein
VGVGNGFVTTWYDQIGINNFTQLSALNQPQIVLSGSVIMDNNKPTISFGTNNNSWYLNSASSFLSNTSSPICIFSVWKITDWSNSNGGVFGPSNGNSKGLEITQTSTISRRSLIRINSTPGQTAVTTDIRNNNSAESYQLWNNDTQSLTSINILSTSLSIFKNGSGISLTSTGGVSQINNINDTYSIGLYSGSYPGYMNQQEMVFFTTDKTSQRPGIESNINSYYSIYSQSNSGFVTTWYDQSGNSNNAFQTTASVQPQIVSNGSLILRNSKPYIEATSSRYFQFTTELYNASGSEYSLWMTYEKNAGGNQAILLKDAQNYMWLDYGIQQASSPNSTFNISAHVANTLYMINTMALNVGSTMYRNSLSIGSGGAPGAARSTNLPASSFRSAKITMSEFIYYPTNKTSQRVGISANINGYYSIHSSNGSAFVTTWYDQSGNGRNATQTSASSQPMILSSGTINLVGGKPSIYFNGVNSISCPYNVGTTNEMYFLTQTTDTVYLYPSNNTLTNYGFVAQYGQFSGLNSNYGSPQLYSNGFLKTLTNRNDIYNVLNGYKLSVHKGANLSAWAGNPMTFGTYAGGGYEYTGDLQEWLIYPTLQGSQSSIESNINSYYSLWDDSIVKSGLVLNLDASYKSSYPATGSTWFDISGSGNNNGTFTNGPIFGTANGGQITFDGINDYILVNNNSSLNLTNLTVSAWVKPITNNYSPIMFRYFNITSYNGWHLYYSGTKFAASGRETSAAYLNITSTNNYAINNWYNLTWTKSGNTWSLYINGVLDNSLNLGVGNVIFTNNNLTIGSEYTTGSAGFSNINIGNVNIYNRPLSTSEILQNFNATKSRFGL